jgi:hypothetical protein
MSTFRNPVGPQPSSVYWRRRLVVGGGLLLVVIVILLIVFSPKGDAKDPSPKPSSSPSNSQSALDGLEPQACNPEAISLTAITDSDQYPADRQPLISMTITNLGAAACTINVGTDAQEYRITSGSDDIWNSRDCQTAPEAKEITLEPGVDNALSTTPFPWDRTRSSTTTCDSDRQQVAAGGGTYRLAVAIGDIESAETKAFLLN